jgi:diacylglycerol O-acyltransferase / wax synthase
MCRRTSVRPQFGEDMPRDIRADDRQQAMGFTRAMASADHAMLGGAGDANSVVPFALVFSTEISRNAVRECLQARLAPYYQFTHRIERGWLRARWVPDAEFSVDKHLDEVRLPPGSGAEEFRAWISGEVRKPLADDRPLWKASLVHAIDGCSALLMRVHHSLADGSSLVDLVSRMTDQGAQPVQAARARVHEELSVGVLLRRAPRVLADALRMFPIRKGPSIRLKDRPGGDPSVAWSDALSLPATREMAHRHDAKVNDVMLAVIAGVLRRWLRAQDPTELAGPLRVVIPIDLRRPGDRHLLGNQFGLVGLDLPVHLPDPLQRLHAVRDAMSALKRGLQGQLALALMRCVGPLPPRLRVLVKASFVRGWTAVVVTNVIGPVEAHSIAGVRIDDVIGFMPQIMMAGIGISIFSYNNVVRIGFLVNNELMPDCSAVAASIRDCFEQLRCAA